MRIWAVMRRDLLKLLRNPLTLMTVVLMPIVYLVVIGNSFNGQLKNLPIAVVNQDGGVYGRRVVERLQALEAGPKTVALTVLDDPARAVAATRNGLYKAAVVVPPGFSRDVFAGREADVGLFLDNVDVVSARTLEAVLDAATGSILGEFVSARRPQLHVTLLRPVELYRTVDYDASLIPGVIVMALFMGSLTSGVFNWVMDKFLGVTEGYLVTPLARWEIAGGMLASGVTVTTAAAIVVLFLGLLLTGTTITGGIPALLTIVEITLLSATGLLAMTFVILGRATHPRLVGVFAGFLNVVLFFPSGAIYPVESFPPWLRAFAAYNPETHAVHALKQILFKGANFAAVAGDLAFLAVFTAVMLVLASTTFKRTL
jgi:ABC-2 type transport system permease protein